MDHKTKITKEEALALIQEMGEILEKDGLDADGILKAVRDWTVYQEKIYQDPLTGCYNRRYYEEVWKDKTIPVGLAVIDMDDFKMCNDTFGHLAGDRMLCELTRVVSEVVRKEDVFLRYGGDEFVLIMPEISEEGFNGALTQIGLKVGEQELPGCNGFRCSVSIGGVMTEGRVLDEVLAEADRRMYRAKTYKNSISTDWMDRRLGERQREADSHMGVLRILIADASEKKRKALIQGLDQEGHVLEAEDGERAREIIYAHKDVRLLVVMDARLPKISGFDLLKEMNQEPWFGNIPMVVMIDGTSADEVRKAYDLKAADCIYWGVPEDIIRHRLHNIIRYYSTQRKMISLISNQIYERERNNHMMVSILSQSMAIHNGESGRHVIHINILTEMLLNELLKKTTRYKLSMSDKFAIVTASSLHDVGKMGIDQAILNKKGALTPEERKAMKQHTIIGAEIMEGLVQYQDEKLMKIAYEICRWHHERYDGRGYPDGLIGEEIPISAQIVSLADVYDALVSERAYKKSYSCKEAVRMIREGKCGAFNPLLVECLEDIQEKTERKLQEDEKGRSVEETLTYRKDMQKKAKETLFRSVSEQIQNDEEVE